MTARELIKALQDLGEEAQDLIVMYPTERGLDWVSDVKLSTHTEYYYNVTDNIVEIV